MIKSGCTRQCVSIPTDKDHCLCEVVDNQRSTDLIQPLRLPETTRHFVGVHVKHKDPNRPVYIFPPPHITRIIANRERQFKVPNPQVDENSVWNIYQQFKSPPPEPKPMIMRNKLYVRPYMQEMLYMKHCRLYYGREYFKQLDEQIPPKTVEEKVAILQEMGDVSDHWTDIHADDTDWVGCPPDHITLSDDERKCRLLQVDPSYKSKGLIWYNQAYPTKKVPFVVQKFAK